MRRHTHVDFQLFLQKSSGIPDDESGGDGKDDDSQQCDDNVDDIDECDN